MAEKLLQIRSFRVVFDLERRIHRIDRFRVPLPYGLPLKSVGYVSVALLVVLILRRVPVMGDVLASLPAPAQYVLLPVGVGYALTRLKLDGRSAHAAALAWLRFTIAPRNLAAFRPMPRTGFTRFTDVRFVMAFPQSRAKTSRTPEQKLVEPPAGQQLAFDRGEQLVIW